MMTRAEKEKWKRIRNTLTPAFSGLKMKQMMPLMNSCCDTLMRKLSKVADKEQSVDMFKFHQALTMDVIISAAFGIEANPQENPDDPVAMAARNSMNRSTFERILLNVLSVMPFGTKIISMFPNFLMANSMPLLKIAEEMVNIKRAGKANLSRKVILYRYY
ncbi:cytochrome P450 3A43-like [Orbicella faveolata]|uniref:cytochrome P450 3A43-like n=1 Tax=Orbicella faveolata TaxID=48498 RepID=UPI0009E5DC47|nr:cytochrome P450 3A43-like [Orbicella faveolata]